MGKKNHVSQESLHDLHHKAFGLTGINDGKCLTGHDAKYEEMTCSYRWQAHVVAKERETEVGMTRYNVRDVPRRSSLITRTEGINTNAYKSKKGNDCPAEYINILSCPENDDWDLDGPSRLVLRNAFGGVPRDIEPRTNFTDAYKPYWHNSHHMIPKSLFNKMIDESGTGGGANPECPAIIRSSLLEAKYNINHKINMIILPQDKEVGEILKLPRHLIMVEKGKEDEVDVVLRKEMMSHVQYDDFVKAKLAKVMMDYKEQVADAQCTDPVKPALSKKRLEDVSLECLRSIVAFGSGVSAGRPLSDIA